MKILGINLNHISTAALLVDGEVVLAVPEERFTRQKMTREFPVNAIKYLLDTEGLTIDDVDAITVGWNPAINLQQFKKPFSQTYRWFPEILYTIPNNIFQIGGGKSCSYVHQEFVGENDKILHIYYVNHHLSHMAMAYYLSNKSESAILSVDGFGEKTSTVWGYAKNNKIEVIQEQNFPQSLGSFYETITSFLGFQPDSDEWKVMGMAAYGNPEVYKPRLLKLVEFKEHGQYEFDLSYFNYFNFDTPGHFTEKLIDLLGDPFDEREVEFDQRQFDLAAAALIQRICL